MNPTRVSAPPALVALGASFPIKLIDAGGERCRERFIEFFIAEISNDHTRRAYARCVAQFLEWCADRGIADFRAVKPVVVAAYLKHLGAVESVRTGSQLTKPTIKQSLAALRSLFDYLVTGHIIEINPAAAVRGPRYSITKGKTPVLDPEQVKTLFISMSRGSLGELRDRALIAVMAYGFARVGAVVQMKVEDYYQEGKRWKLRLFEKNGKVLEMPVHHAAEEFLDTYLAAAGIQAEKKSPLFRTMDRWGRLRDGGMSGRDALKMVKRRAKRAGLPESTTDHCFRATCITTYLSNGGTLKEAQRLAGHSDPRTTELYDHSGDELTLDEVEKIHY